MRNRSGIFRPGKDSGMTLVEMGVVLLLAGIVFTGMLVTYVNGIGYWKSTSDMLLLYNEGTIALEKMSKWIRNASYIQVRPMAGEPNAKLELRYNNSAWSAAFYFIRSTGELRWNDQTENRNQFNMRLLPAVSYRGRPRGEDPYLSVKRLEFIPLDDIGHGSPTLLGYSLIRVEMVLENQDGDTLFLSSVTSKRNKK